MIETLQILSYMGPLITALVCSCLILLHYKTNNSFRKKKLSLILICFFSCSSLNWFGLICYICDPQLFVYINSFLFLSIMLSQIIIYKFIFTLIQTNRSQTFSKIHYIVPSLFFVGIAIWSFFIPLDIQLAIVNSPSTHPAGYKIYAMCFTSKLPLLFIYNLFYSLAAFHRIRKYCNVVTSHNQIYWLFRLIIITLATSPAIAFPFLMNTGNRLYYILTFIPLFATVLQYVLLYCKTTIDSYTILSISNNTEKELSERKEKHRLCKEQFDIYIQKEKPYLNPKLKIIDLTLPFYTNRTYLSSFINRNYGMSFSRYINERRIEEFMILKKNPQYNKYNEQELIYMAGFNNYRSYLRSKNISHL